MRTKKKKKKKFVPLRVQILALGLMVFVTKKFQTGIGPWELENSTCCFVTPPLDIPFTRTVSVFSGKAALRHPEWDAGTEIPYDLLETVYYLPEYVTYLALLLVHNFSMMISSPT